MGGSSSGHRAQRLLLVFALSASLLPLGVTAANASQDPEIAGFEVTEIFSGLDDPVSIEFAPDGRVFIGEKSGVVKVFDGVSDISADVVADFSGDVHNFWDRGMLGLALDPDWATDPFVYVLYALDEGDQWNDGCPSPPGSTVDGCVVDGRLSRFQVNASNSMVGGEQVLLEGFWCQQYPSHSIGDLAFDAQGALIVSAGDGASFTFVDYGQRGIPLNPCDDPPSGVSGTQEPAFSAEGGALRSQDLLTTADAFTYDGSVIRVSKTSGAPFPTNPLIGGVAGDDPIIAHGLRNPFRITVRPGTNEVWVGDVGWSTWEEIDRIADTTDALVENFGWPCYEGPTQQPAYQGTGLALCEGLYDQTIASDLTPPVLAISHSSPPASCPGGGASISGLAFYEGGPYPPPYDGALFFADYSFKCIRVMFPDLNGDPDPVNVATIVSNTGVVDLAVGPDGDIFFVDLDAAAVFRLRFPAGNHAPVADIQAAPTSGAAPLTVNFDGTGSTDADGDPLAYEWDLDGDGEFDDSTSPTPQWTFTSPILVNVSLRVTDPTPEFGIATIQIQALVNSPPTAIIDTPAEGSTWAVGQTISFSGHGEDPDTGLLTGSALQWELILHHCATPGSCHQHSIMSLGGDGGSFDGMDHEVPSFLELQLTVTDHGALEDTTSIQLDPETVTLTFQTEPDGLDLVVGPDLVTDPYSAEVIVGGAVSLSAPSPQTSGSHSFAFAAWSDGGNQTHLVTAPSNQTTYVATFSNGPPVASDDGYSLEEGGTLDTAAASLPPVLDNDTDPEDDPLTALLSDGPDHGTLSLSPDGAFVYVHDGTETTADSFTYRANDGLSDSNEATVSLVISGVNEPPVPSITSPAGSASWIVGDLVSFSGAATDPEDGLIGASGLTWKIELIDCQGGCSTTTIAEYEGVAAGSFTAPEPSGPATLTVTLTATDSGGLAASTARPFVGQTVTLTLATDPDGLELFLDGAPAPDRTTIEKVVGSTMTIGAGGHQLVGTVEYAFRAWSDGGDPTHVVTAPQFDQTYVGLYERWFIDVGGNVHEDNIEFIWRRQITNGCDLSGPRYCPHRSITRGQLAAMLVRALELSPSSIDFFDDDDASMFEDEINALAQAGITNGCGPRAYCPHDDLTRGQMAALLARAFDVDWTSGVDWFWDDNGSLFESDINALRDRGVTIGCNPEGDRYCPADPVTRAQFASFLARALPA